MTCNRCDEGERRPVTAGKLADDGGRVAVVLGVPMEECPACGVRWLTWEVAQHLDVLLDEMLSGEFEVATRHYAG